MPLAETLIITVAPAIAKTVVKLWAGDQKPAAEASEAGGAVIDVLAKLIPDLRASKEANRQVEAIGEKAAASLQFIFDTEGRTLLADDQEAVAKLVAKTLDRTKITTELLVSRDLDPVRLADHFITQAHEDLATLTRPRIDLFRRVIQAASQSIIDIAHQLPNFNERTFAELLRGNRVLVEAVGRVFEQLDRIRAAQTDPQTESAQFETDYRLAVSRNLNRMELFGVDLAQSSRSHPLSVAYVSLEVSRGPEATSEPKPSAKAKLPEAGVPEGDDEEPVIQNVEAALAESRRILIKGPAGAGKTTLVRWIAVQAASRTFEHPLEEWNTALPFLIRLRHFSDAPFPLPEAFPGLVASLIAGAMPRGWVHEKLKSGMAVVMIDGVDEIADGRRDEVRVWIKELINAFPSIRIVVTSRPHAAEEGWLESDGFSEADLQPMDTNSVDRFIEHWHKTVAAEVQGEEEAIRLTMLAANLKNRLRDHRAVQKLAASPLLCGVICALHRDTNEQLPSDRVELYERCCAMLLERRDLESGLKLADYPRLTYRQKRAVLDDLAYWMIKNQWTEILIDSARDRIAKKLENLKTDSGTGTAPTAHNVLELFLERSGMLRQPLEGSVVFAHRTFQEFMAAQAAVLEGDIGVLATNATSPQWREVIILGAGLARPRERSALVVELLSRAHQTPQQQYELTLLAAACLDTAVEVDPLVKAEVEGRVRQLVPPSGMSEAILLAGNAGNMAVPFLKFNRALTARQAAACVRALGLIGSPEALQMIAGYIHDDRRTVAKEIVRAYDRFDPDSYMAMIESRFQLGQTPGGVVGLILAKSDLKAMCDVSLVKTVSFKDMPMVELPPALQDLTNLTHLTLWNTHVSDISMLGGLTKLKFLDLENSNVADLSPLQGLSDLELLFLTNTPVRDLSPLTGLSNLTRLFLAFTEVTDVSPLYGLTKLTMLNLRGTGATSDQREALKLANPHLEIY